LNGQRKVPKERPPDNRTQLRSIETQAAVHGSAAGPHIHVRAFGGLIRLTADKKSRLTLRYSPWPAGAKLGHPWPQTVAPFPVRRLRCSVRFTG